MNSNNNNNEQKRMIFKNKIQFKLTRAAMQISERDHPFWTTSLRELMIMRGFLCIWEVVGTKIQQSNNKFSEQKSN